MNQHLTFVTLGVADVAASRRFYVDGLGWTPLLDLPGEITFFQVGHGLVLGIWGIDRLGADADAPATAGTPFALVIPGAVELSRLPTDEELRLIRDVIDPEATREREVPNR